MLNSNVKALKIKNKFNKLGDLLIEKPWLIYTIGLIPLTTQLILFLSEYILNNNTEFPNISIGLGIGAFTILSLQAIRDARLNEKAEQIINLSLNEFNNKIFFIRKYKFLEAIEYLLKENLDNEENIIDIENKIKSIQERLNRVDRGLFWYL